MCQQATRLLVCVTWGFPRSGRMTIHDPPLQTFTLCTRVRNGASAWMSCAYTRMHLPTSFWALVACSATRGYLLAENLGTRSELAFVCSATRGHLLAEHLGTPH